MVLKILVSIILINVNLSFSLLTCFLERINLKHNRSQLQFQNVSNSFDPMSKQNVRNSPLMYPYSLLKSLTNSTKFSKYLLHEVSKGFS